MGNRHGWWGMSCWNGLSDEQQHRLITVGNLPLGYRAEGRCPNGAEVQIETEHDEAPGPRFYCLDCGIQYLTEVEHPVDYDGPDPKVTCAYPPCVRKLRRVGPPSMSGEAHEQFCSKSHRTLKEQQYG